MKELIDGITKTKEQRANKMIALMVFTMLSMYAILFVTLSTIAYLSGYDNAVLVLLFLTMVLDRITNNITEEINDYIMEKL